MVEPSRLAWLALLSPLVSAIGILLFGVHRRRLAAAFAIGGLLISFACILQLFLATNQGALSLPWETSVNWISISGFSIPLGVLIDRLSLLMALIVTGVGSLIFIYSTSYMAEDPAFSRYFGMLSLFAFSMLMIVLATNWIQLFMGWELVGFCSYMLIGHWYAKPSAAEAGKKAFMVNRVADFGLMLGILILWALSGSTPSERSFHFLTLEQRLPLLISTGVISLTALPLVGLLIFCGPVGKSAQFPLHVWLPDAMEGPTPVSALIHAATMVAAGVYLLCRAFWLFSEIHSVMNVIMTIGAATAFLSACLALVENDLKRILAYSTLSQLGYMVMAVGLGGRAESMYHLTTHAFFKALLFLAAGSVIHATHEQDIRKLGGLYRSMPWTSATFFVGALALCGFPGLSGFFSKDEILVLAAEHQPAVFAVAVITAGLTAFYTLRAWLIAFAGKPHNHHAHESGFAMVAPLAVLSVFSVVAGYLGIPHFLEAHPEPLHLSIAAISVGVMIAGGVMAWLLYGKRRLLSAEKLVQALAIPYSFLQRRYYIDEFYS
ncbi:MAG: NADH-quinone oxidoreductase subunit L, partial [Candidatus Omnitrophica bacterium]|nr:NADH-quinone oxidoreductase subunit L [Candidatus Omnitrophota bacterium]